MKVGIRYGGYLLPPYRYSPPRNMWELSSLPRCRNLVFGKVCTEYVVAFGEANLAR